MANRRMFSKDITNSEEFLEMPDSCQKLYFHLGMNADDDGFVQPKGVMRLVRSGDDDLKVLRAKGFVIVFGDNVIVITHWKTNNDIRVDRYKPTIYQEHLKTLGLTENKAYTKDKSVVVPVVVPPVNQMDTQVRLGKDRIYDHSLSPSESSSPHLLEEEDWRPPGEEGIDYVRGEDSLGPCWTNMWGKVLRPPKPSKDKIFEKQFMTLIAELNPINPTAGALIRRKVEREGAQTMIDAIGFEKTLGWVKILKETNSREGFPKITTLSQLALHYSWLRDKYHGK